MSIEIALGLNPKLLPYYLYHKKPIKEVNEIMFQRIIDVVSLHTGVDYEKMRSSSRKREITASRQLAMYLIDRLTSMSLVEIGKRFGGRDHSTVINSKNVVKDVSSVDKQFNELLTGIIREIEVRKKLNF